MTDDDTAIVYKVFGIDPADGPQHSLGFRYFVAPTFRNSGSRVPFVTVGHYRSVESAETVARILNNNRHHEGIAWDTWDTTSLQPKAYRDWVHERIAKAVASQPREEPLKGSEYEGYDPDLDLFDDDEDFRPPNADFAEQIELMIRQNLRGH